MHSLNSSKSLNFEVVIIDNNSDVNLRPKYINYLHFNFPIKLITLDYDSMFEFYSITSIYNFAFNHSIGDILIIHNSEYEYSEKIYRIHI